MRATENFRRQHRELSQDAMDLLSKLEPVRIGQHAESLRRDLSRFVGKLRVHAAMEQDALYPRLLADPEASIRDKARQLLAEVGELYEEVFRFSERWASPSSLRADPQRFQEETQELLRRLGARMVRENSELYPLVDAAHAQSGAAPEVIDVAGSLDPNAAPVQPSR